jgi:HlyD family secretion protein
MATLEVEADVAESSIAKVAVGTPCEITLEAFPELRLLGEVSRIVPTVDRAKATVLVKVAFVERDVRVLPDMSAKVAFYKQKPTEADRKPVTALRKEAVATRDGKIAAFVFDGKNVKLTLVTQGRDLGESVEISGLKTGDRVVLKPDAKLQDGATAVQAAKK